MQKKLFIGIDFSKSTFDVSVLEHIGANDVLHHIFENNTAGYKRLLKWLSKQSKIKRSDWLFCGEHTGLYSRGLSNFLAKKDLTMWLENPLQIKYSQGISRGKSDRMDSLRIARYSIRHIDRLTVYKPASKEIEALRLLFSYRDRLVKVKVALEVSAKEIRGVISRDQTSRLIFEDSNREVERIVKRIKAMEEEMHKVIINSELKRNYLLMMSIKGVGMITTVAMIVRTNNFESFESARQLASYCGCAPFPNESGTINNGSRISHLANKELKVLLTQCARSAARFDYELQKYYHRKKAEGKKEKVVINNIRNKLIQRIFAIIRSGIPYTENYINPFEDAA
jgi:transposase